MTVFIVALSLEAFTLFSKSETILGYSLLGYFSIFEVKLLLPYSFFGFYLGMIGLAEKYKILRKSILILGITVLLLTMYNLGLFIASKQTIHEQISDSVVELVFMGQQLLALILCYIVLSLSFIETFWLLKSNLKEKLKGRLRLLIIFLVVVSFIVLSWSMELIRIFSGGIGEMSLMIKISWLTASFSIYFISFLLLKYPYTPEFKINLNRDESEIKDIANRIKIEMANNGYFKKSDLTISEFAKLVGIPARKISTAINDHFNCNFSHWVNEFRVDFAIELVASDKKYSLEGAGIESGFKSRSSMYLAFNKIKGKSPGEYQNKS
ncbi:MAG: AraC family transcriptional regulator [Flavobacteriales bacterium]|nr:AraC family transcriptional regulator [Flavobacteriales bacterium]